MAEEQSNIKVEDNLARAGMNMDLSVNQIPKGVLTYALNGALENFDANSTSYQNEPGNVLCLEFPEGYQLIGKHFIPEQNKHIFFLANPDTNSSEIGYMINNDCVYRIYINADCLNFSIDNPIPKAVHKITNCTTELYWPDQNGRRFLDLTNPPYIVEEGGDICENVTTSEIDCNKLKVQPSFKIPSIEIDSVVSGGNLTSGTVQFAMQYSNALGDPYTSYYSVTNPVPIADTKKITSEYIYPVGKSVIFNISNIDISGYFKYYNVAVIKTVAGITSVELIGTYFIEESTKQITYNGQNQAQIRLTINDIFEKYPYYDIADDVTAVQDVIVWKGLTSIDRINYQQIANNITLQWETWRIPATENYADEINSANFRGYLRDEVYPFEIVFLLDNGKQTDSFHIPGRAISFTETSQPDILSTNPDFIGTGASAKYWETYNTASVTGTDAGFTTDANYKGPFQYGEFAYWESSETYPCNTEIWGDLAGQPIRHHKFPDVLVSPIFETSDFSISTDLSPVIENKAIYPIGVKINSQQVKASILSSNLTSEQKSSIIGFKIVRGDRSTNRSIVAKGILRNVGKYTREGQDFFFPNYPYNDLRVDPFLLSSPNSYYEDCNSYTIVATSNAIYQHTSCETNQEIGTAISAGQTVTVCSNSLPVLNPSSAGTVTIVNYDTYYLKLNNPDEIYERAVAKFLYENTSGILTEVDLEATAFTVLGDRSVTIQVLEGTVPYCFSIRTQGLFGIWRDGGTGYSISKLSSAVDSACYPDKLEAFTTDDSKYRHVFNSPETSFGQPFLGNILKLESAVFGGGKGHFVPVKNNALYKLITKDAQEKALRSSEDIASIGTFSPSAMFTAYQSYLTIYINGITRKNYGWSYNSIASYNYNSGIANGLGIKQRKLDIAQYLIPGVQSAGDTYNINNYDRESSIYLKTEGNTPLPYAQETDSLLKPDNSPFIVEKSRYVNSEQDCTNPGKEFDIDVVSYYGSIKNNISNQWGQIYSYESIDTGFQSMFKEGFVTFFGGDTFINKFSFKTKLPFFIDNRVGAPDDSDIFYDEIGNVAYPAYWHSSRSILYDYTPATVTSDPILKNIISIKAHNLDCPDDVVYVEPGTSSISSSTTSTTSTSTTLYPSTTEKMYYNGKMYMFAYGIPTFYVESSVNVDLRQAFNNREGDFYPHVSTGIPDDWVQETFVPIAQDNTYNYNVTYSKQNKENFFSHLPLDWEDQLCYTDFPFRAIFSEKQQSYSDNRINSWLIYKPSAFFDFPQNYGNFTSIDGIENRQVLARFDNKSLLYNAMYTTQTNTQGQVYLGQPLFSKDNPPLDFAETDLGYVGSQHKFLLKIPQGQISVDAKRGQVFLLQGSKATDLSGFGSGLNRFFTDHLAFEILRYYPTIDVDNNFKNIGLHGVFDSKFDRVIISKLDYIPLFDTILYEESTKSFYIVENTTGVDTKKYLELTDTNYFCNKSWTLSFNMNTMSWVSFHSYIPNFYIAENNFFYSGINESCDLEAIVAEEVPTTTTTTTTVAPFSCDLEGEARVPDCTIEGMADYSGTTTTSTTTSSTTSTSTSTTTSTSTSTTSTTTTEAPTTTTTSTTTTIAFFAHRRGNTPSGTECSVCPPNYGSGFFYTGASDTVPTIGMVVYTDSTLTTPFNGGDQWWAIEWAGPSASSIDGILVGTDGIVDDTHICSVDCTTTTTTTSTSSTTTTTTTATPEYLFSVDNDDSLLAYSYRINGGSWVNKTTSYSQNLTIGTIVEVRGDDSVDKYVCVFDGTNNFCDVGQPGSETDFTMNSPHAFTVGLTECLALGCTTTTTTTAAPINYVTLNTYSVSDTCTGTVDCLAGGSVSERVTSSVNPILTAPYSYLWEYVSGSALVSADTPTAFRTIFRATVPCEAGGNTIVSVWRVRVTDALSQVEYSPNLTITFTNDSATCD